MRENIEQNIVSRQEFLKLSGLVGGALAFSSLPKPIKNTLPLSEQNEAKERVRIDTDLATYYPFYEKHSNPITLQELKEVKLDLLFHEAAEPAKLVQSMSNEFIVDFTLSKNGEQEKNEMYKHFSDNEISIAWEGVDIPKKYRDSEIVILLGAYCASALLLLKNVPKISDMNLKETILGLTGFAWSVSPLYALGLCSLSENIPADKRTHQTKIIRRALQRIHASALNFHPEYLDIFFRNIIAARKLQILAKYQTKENNSLPKIGYVMGAAHTGIEDLLILGEQFTLSILSIYPKIILEHIINHNGGIDAFCKTVMASLELDNNNNIYITRTTIDDTELKSYLESRLEEK